jgi:hypothetical protein
MEMIKDNMDTRTDKEIKEETCNSICELQDEVGILFPWSMYDFDEVTITNKTIQLLIQTLKYYKEKAEGNFTSVSEQE